LGQQSVLTIGFSEEDTYIYGRSKAAITVFRDYKWSDHFNVDVNDAAKLVINEDGGFDGTEAFDGELMMQKADGFDIYRLADFYGEGFDLRFAFDIEAGTVKLYCGETAPQNGWVAQIVSTGAKANGDVIALVDVTEEDPFTYSYLDDDTNENVIVINQSFEDDTESLSEWYDLIIKWDAEKEPEPAE
jgi:hypothetical protein